MALAIAEANAVSHEHFDETFKQQIYKDSALLTKMQQKNKIKIKGGTNIQFPIRYRKLSMADAIDARDQLTYEQKTTRTAGTLDWKYYYAQALISWDERVKNSGDAQVVSLLKDKAVEMREDFYDRLATDLYTSNPNGKGITPIATIVDATSSYAGIAVADASAWAATENSTTTLSLYGANSLSYMVNQATFGQYKPTFHLTSKNLRSTFMALFEGQKIYEDRELANAGFDNVLFMGAPVASDEYMTASTWYGLDLENIEMFVHPDFGPKLDDWFELGQVGYPNAMARVMTWCGGMVCHLRRSSFKFTNLNYQTATT